MVPRRPPTPATPEVDETAWLDRTAELVRSGRLDEVNAAALAEYLADMARRDRREVAGRLVVLLAHWLKGEYQPARRSRSCLGTILEQQRELRQLLESGSLQNHAVEVLPAAYADARKQAAAESGLPRSDFPEACPWDLPGVLVDLAEDD